MGAGGPLLGMFWPTPCQCKNARCWANRCSSGKGPQHQSSQWRSAPRQAGLILGWA